MSNTPTASTFARLKDLAGEHSSDKRRELLRSVTDMFLAGGDDKTDSECVLFDEVVGAVVKEMQATVRAELADQLADSKAPINKTLKRFAMDDDIEVARPILERSEVLTDEDLIEVITNRTQEHMLAITRRQGISEKVSGALVENGTDQVVASLIDNYTAKIGRETMEKVADRAQTSVVLQKPMVRRDDVPLDLLNELVLVVQNDLRNEIMARFDDVPEAKLEAALAKSRREIRKNYGAQTREQKLAVQELDRLQRTEPLKLSHLHYYLKDNDIGAFAEALSRLAGIGYHPAMNIYKKRDVDSLALIMKALNAPVLTFATVAAYIAEVKSAVNIVQHFSGVYKEVPTEAAARALRFWKVRNVAEKEEGQPGKASAA